MKQPFLEWDRPFLFICLCTKTFIYLFLYLFVCQEVQRQALSRIHLRKDFEALSETVCFSNDLFISSCICLFVCRDVYVYIVVCVARHLFIYPFVWMPRSTNSVQQTRSRVHLRRELEAVSETADSYFSNKYSFIYLFVYMPKITIYWFICVSKHCFDCLLIYLCASTSSTGGSFKTRSRSSKESGGIFLWDRPVFSGLFVWLVVVCPFLSSFEYYEIVQYSLIYLFVHHFIDLFVCLVRSTKEIVRHLLFSFVDWLCCSLLYHIIS